MLRMIVELDAFARDHPDEEVLIQAGPAAYSVAYARAVSYLPEADLRSIALRSRIVVTHAGPSLLLELVDEGHVPIVMPRERRFNEHVDDHQVEFAEHLKSRGLAIMARSQVDLRNALEQFGTLCLSLQRVDLPRADPDQAASIIRDIVMDRSTSGNGHQVHALARLTSNAIPLAVQRGLPALTMIAITILVAHGFTQAEVARWVVLAGLISIGRVAADFGLEKALPRWIAATGAWSEGAGRATATRLLTGVLSGLIVVAVGATLIGPGPDLLLAGIVPLTQTLTVVATAWAIVGVRTSSLLLPSILGFIVAVGLSIAVGPVFGLSGVIASMAIGGIIETAMAWRLVGVRARRTGFSVLGIAGMLQETLGFGTQSVLGVIYARVPVLLLAAVGPGLVVQFALGYNVYAAIALGSSALALTTFARLNQAVTGRSRPAFVTASRQFVAAALVIVLLAAVVAVFAEPIVRVAFTDAYVSAADVTRILMLTVPLSVANGYLSVALFALRADRVVVAISVAAVVLLAVLTVAAVPIGSGGAALALFATECVIAVIASLVLVRRISDLS